MIKVFELFGAFVAPFVTVIAAALIAVFTTISHRAYSQRMDAIERRIGAVTRRLDGLHSHVETLNRILRMAKMSDGPARTPSEQELAERIAMWADIDDETDRFREEIERISNGGKETHRRDEPGC